MKRFVLLGLCGWLGLCPRHALAEEGAERGTEEHHFRFVRGGALPVSYPDSAQRVGWVDLGVTLAFAGVALGAFLSEPNSGSMTAGSIDLGIREALGASNQTDREIARRASDVLWGTTLGYGAVVDPLVNAWWLRQSPDVAWQIAAMNVEVEVIRLGTQQLVAHLVGRERPCAQNGAEDPSCGSEGLDLSFYSGHTSSAFAAATATCTHHAFIPLSGRHAWVTCLALYSAATAVGFFRIVGDKHYASDVAVGALVGSATGFLVPAFHYLTGVRPLGAGAEGSRILVLPSAAPGGALVSVVGLLR